MYVLLEAQDSMLQWQVLRSGFTSRVMVHASASRLIIMQLRTIEALRVRVQLSMRQTEKQEVQGQTLLLHTDCG